MELEDGACRGTDAIHLPTQVRLGGGGSAAGATAVFASWKAWVRQGHRVSSSHELHRPSRHPDAPLHLPGKESGAVGVGGGLVLRPVACSPSTRLQLPLLKR